MTFQKLWQRKNKNPRKKRQATLAELEQDLHYRNKKTDSQWRKAFFWLRVTWAIVPLILLVATAYFTWWLTNGVGTKQLDFSQYTVFLDIVAADIIINVLGLVAIVMRFLFPSPGNDKKVPKKSTEDAEKDDEIFELPSLDS